MGSPGATALRRVVLAASVVFEIDLAPRAYGLVLAGVQPVNVTWTQPTMPRQRFQRDPVS